jgi:predicted component of type VI protein secretion system
MPSRLVALDEGPDIPLDRDPIVVGRHPECDVRLNSVRVSRHHCCLIAVDEQVAVRDLGSMNGTRINDRRVASGRLRMGDVVSIGGVRFRLAASEGPGTGKALPAASEQPCPDDAGAADDTNEATPAPWRPRPPEESLCQYHIH